MKRFLVFLFFFSSAASGKGWAVTPMDYYHSLVAGGDEAGLRDGTFVSARFRDPAGLALDEKGLRLYVADSGNHRIRVVYLDRNNEVGSLAGTSAPGSMDGSLSQATFDSPTRLAALSGDRLAVFDQGNGSIRLIDLPGRKVATLAKGVTLDDMVYDPEAGCLYFSQSEQGRIEKLDLKTLAVSTVLAGEPKIPSPGPLCLFQHRLCVADHHLPTVYEATSPMSNGAASAPLSAVGKAKDVLALAASDGSLYALRKGGVLTRVGLPDSTDSDFPTPWGFLIKNTDHQGDIPLLNIPDDAQPGFLASSMEPRKFFISTQNLIAAIKDYDFAKRWGAIEGNKGVLTDFDYPVPKPAKTFRILAAGSSKNSTAVPLPSDVNDSIDENTQSPRVETFPKQLELLLNTESTLQGWGIHFEVLNFTRRGAPISSFGYDDLPDLVRKYDIDLVLGLGDLTGYKDYFERPMAAGGIPAKSIDYEYLLKPLSERAQAPAAKDLLERCKKLKIPVSEKQNCPGDGLFSLFCSGDPGMQEDLAEMTGQRLGLLNGKLGSMKTSAGKPPQLVMFYVPCRAYPNDCLEPFWNGVCSKNKLKFIDLTESYDALKMGYYPTHEIHYTAYGNGLIALLLEHCLVEQKLVPSKP